MPEISNKKRKFIKRNFKQLSIEELARQTGLKPNVIRSLVDEYSAKMTGKDQHSLKKLTSDKDPLKKRSIQVIGIGAIVIFLLILIVYTPALKNDFVWDDILYVSENTMIHSLSMHSLCGMLTSFHASNWHPLTWLSHAIDYALWDLDPLGHRLTNIILHGLNTFLLFLLIIRLMMNGKGANRMPSPSKIPLSISINSLTVAGITALLFGLHPLHVESVAWVAERKDLLCSFFIFSSTLSYLLYTSSVGKRDKRFWFSTCLFLFLLALMSKPMAVTLPIILLLLDLYPLKRLKPYLDKNLSLLLEKIPFFILSITSSAITIIAQHSGGTVKSLESLPISFRLANALHSLVFYLKKMLWPLELVPFYPLPKYVHPFDLQYIISAILVLAITAMCIWMMKKENYLFFTLWSYYLITLLPVLGIIQVGDQAAADRYTYLPSISPFLLVGIAMAWGWEKFSLMKFKVALKGLLLIFISIVVFLLSYLTISQIKIWHNSEIFWGYVISAFPFPKSNPLVHYNLGNAYDRVGKLDETISQYKQALALKPHYPKAHNNLGVAYVKKGILDEAICEFNKALAIKPHYAEVHNNLGIAYFKKGMLDKAIAEYERAIAIEPRYPKAHNNLGYAYVKKGILDEAISEFKKELTINPNDAEALYSLGFIYDDKGLLDEAIYEYKKALAINLNYAKAHNNLGIVYFKKGMLDEAISEYKKALAINPNFSEAHYDLGLAYSKKGNLNEAISEFNKAIVINPNFTEAYYKLGLVLKAQGKLSDAISAYREVIQLKSDYVLAYSNLAWIYATSPNASIRDGDEAVALATKACELEDFKNVEALDTLAAAYAEQKNFRKAVEYQYRAIKLSPPQIKEELQKRLQLYKLGRAYRDQ